MDPIGLTANVISLIQACATIASYVSKVKEAEADCNKVTSELNSTVAILKELEALIRRLEKDDSSNRQACLSALAPLYSNNVVEVCQADLNEFVGWLNKQSEKMKRVSGKLLWPLKGKRKVENLLKKLQSQKMLFVLALQIESRHTLTDSRDAFEEFVTKQKVRNQESHWLKVMKWLRSVDYESKHKTVWARREMGTCSWLLDHPQFITWQQSSSSIMLHLRGIPGCGKSTLISTVINALQEPDESFGPCALAYHYCDFRNEDSRNPAVVLRTLLVQFTKFDPSIDTLDNLARHRNEKLHTPTFLDDIYALLVPAIRAARYTPVVVVDALDECSDFRALIQELERLHNDVAGIRILVSSRSEESIITLLKGRSFIDITKEARSVNSDIALHIDKSFDPPSRVEWIPEDLIPEVKRTLLSRASGMFRLVDAQIALLKLSHSRSDIMKSLQTLPQDLYEVYDRILLAIEERGEGSQRIVHRTLQWLFGAAGSLTLSELNEAMMIKLDPPSLDRDLGILDPSSIVEACGSLVQYNKDGDTVTISHYTVKYFTIKRQSSNCRVPRLLLEYDWSRGKIEFNLACQSVAYLSTVSLPSSVVTSLQVVSNASHDNFSRRSPLVLALGHLKAGLQTTYPLFRHVAKYWQHYLLDESLRAPGASNRIPDDLLDRAWTFLLDRERLILLLVVCNKFPRIMSPFKPSPRFEEIPLSFLIYLAIDNWFHYFRERMLRNDQDSTNRSLHPWTRLFVAVTYHDFYIVKYEAGVNVAEESAAVLEALAPKSLDFKTLQLFFCPPRMDPCSTRSASRFALKGSSIWNLRHNCIPHNSFFYPLFEAGGDLEFESDTVATDLINNDLVPRCWHTASTLVKEGCDPSLQGNDSATFFQHNIFNITQDIVSSHPGVVDNRSLSPACWDPYILSVQLPKARDPRELDDLVSHLDNASQSISATTIRESHDAEDKLSSSAANETAILVGSGCEPSDDLHAVYPRRRLRRNRDSINKFFSAWTRLYMAVTYRDFYVGKRKVYLGINDSAEATVVLGALEPKSRGSSRLQSDVRVDPSSKHVNLSEYEQYSIWFQTIQRKLHNTFAFYSLVKAAKDLNLRSDDGATAMVTWGRDNQDHMAPVLVEAGCDPSLRDPNGHTIFWHVLNVTNDFISSHPGIVEKQILTLIETGCDPRVPISLDPKMTVLEKARSLGLVDVVSYLERSLSTTVAQEQATPAEDEAAVLVEPSREPSDDTQTLVESLSDMQVEADEVSYHALPKSEDGVHVFEKQWEAFESSTTKEIEHADALSQTERKREPESNKIAISNADDVQPTRPHGSEIEGNLPDNAVHPRPNIPDSLARNGELRGVLWTGISGLAVLYCSYLMVLKIIYYMTGDTSWIVE
ncbi:unnamed protein product [Somion occarium]|uniref:Nephrocystin 3-like N-terminal domain-containing protein n=1 Tax=Somion occarium TaxID=3059160 RepID=A0ABP1DDF6_9APHY